MTDDPVHGHQEGAFFNKYYNEVCYAPLYIFCRHHLLVAKLRPSNVDPAEGALEELQRVMGLKKMAETLTLTGSVLDRGKSLILQPHLLLKSICEKCGVRIPTNPLKF